jgi:GNAT superfamily N-acetyltransferase
MNKLELLDSTHDRIGFDCGREPLNNYIQQVAKQHGERGISRTFVLADEGATAPKQILGFFSLSACEAESETLPAQVARKLPRKIPAVRLGRLAVSLAHQGRGIGKELVVMALRKTAEGAERLGVAGLFVDAKDESVAKFYHRFGFEPLPSDPLTLFMTLQTLKTAIAETEAP